MGDRTVSRWARSSASRRSGPRRRSRWRAVAVLMVCGFAVSCADSIESGTATTTAPVEPASAADVPPPGAARGPSAFVVGDRVWVGGGVVSRSGSVRSVAGYNVLDDTGTVVARVGSTLRGSETIVHTSAVTDPAGVTVLAEQVCVRRVTTPQRCPEMRTRLQTVVGEALVEGPSLGPAGAALGRFSLIGATDSRLIGVEESGDGRDVIVVDLADNEAVAHAASLDRVDQVCASGNDVYGVTADGRTGEIVHARLDSRGTLSKWQPWDTLEDGGALRGRDPAKVEGGLACVGNLGVWVPNLRAGVLVPFELETGASGSGALIFRSGRGRAPASLCTSGDDVVVSGRDRRPTDLRYAVVAGSAGTQTVERAQGARRAPLPRGCSLSGTVIDGARAGSDGGAAVVS